jgi:hypothetical protein
MSIFTSTEIVLDHKFDPVKKQHYLNGELSVLHCHHFTTLYSQLAIDSEETEVLADTARDTFHASLSNYFSAHGIESAEHRVSLACQHYGAVGLGKMEVVFIGADSGEVRLQSSHLDAGWIKKWGPYNKPVNHLTRGFIEGMFAAILSLPSGAFKAREVKSIVMGAPESVFTIVRK